DLRGHRPVVETDGDGVSNGGSCGVLEGKRDCGHVTDSLDEARAELRDGKGEDSRVIDPSVLIDLEDDQTIREGSHSHHVEESSLGQWRVSESQWNAHLVENLYGSSSDLSGNLESLEEGSLLGTHSSILWRNIDVTRSDGASLGGGSLSVLEKLISYIGQVLLGENESDVFDDGRDEDLKRRNLGHMGTDRLDDHRVLSH
ncbi:hypothetical protein PENTCL1PPCAC_2816, partial [Pristionchus entomophagus]